MGPTRGRRALREDDGFEGTGISLLTAALTAATLLLATPAWAHKPSDSYLAVDVKDQQIALQWDIALRDLDMAIGLDDNGDGELTWNEVKAKHADIASYAQARLALASDGASCPLTVTSHALDDHTDGAYAVIYMAATCAQPVATLDLKYALLFDIDPQHKGLLRLTHAGKTSTAIFTPDSAQQKLSVAGRGSWAQFVDYVRQGVWHIWIGFDHILFLLALLLPAVMVHRDGRWQGRERFRAAFIETLKIVTAFTLAHSITLTLATLGVVELPSRWVESAIAFSVVLAALNNVWPVLQRRLAWMAFGFGLIHGFGFASVLADLGLPPDALRLSLVGFNVGVELGQLTLVAIFLPLAYLARNQGFYRSVILRGGSILIALAGALWLIERVFDLKLLG